MHVAGGAGSGHGPVAWQLLRPHFGLGFEIDQRGLGEQAAALKRFAGLGQQAAGERRVEKHEFDTRRRLPGLTQPVPGRGVVDFRVFRLENLRVFRQRPARARVAFDKYHSLSSPGESFEPEGAAACEQVQADPAFDFLLQPVEQGFPNPVRSRPQAVDIRKVQQPAAQFAADDAHGGFLPRSGVLFPDRSL